MRNEGAAGACAVCSPMRILPVLSCPLHTEAPKAEDAKADATGDADADGDSDSDGDDDDDEDEDTAEVVARRTRASTVKTLRAMLDDKLTRVRLLLYLQYTSDAVKLIRQAEAHPDNLPYDWVARMLEYKAWLEHRHVDCPTDITEAITSSGSSLSAMQRQAVTNDVVRSIEACFPRFNHSACSCGRCGIPPTSRPALRPASRSRLASSFASDQSHKLFKEAEAYARDWQAGKFDTWLKLVPVKAASFWKRASIVKVYPLLSRVALHYLSIPLSSATVERAFSKLTRMESPLRKALLDESVRREHFIQCHRTAIEVKLDEAVKAHEAAVAARAAALAAVTKK